MSERKLCRQCNTPLPPPPLKKRPGVKDKVYCSGTCRRAYEYAKVRGLLPVKGGVEQ